MNSRQAKKSLKKQIQKLQSDNDLMRSIISNSPQMQELYDLYNKPLNVTHYPIKFEQYKTRKEVPRDYLVDDIILSRIKEELLQDFIPCLKDNITYEIDLEIARPTSSIAATVFIGRKE